MTSTSSSTTMDATDTLDSSTTEESSSSGSSSSGSESSSSESTGVVGCQMEMDGADVLAFLASRDERMPTLAETRQWSRAIASVAGAGLAASDETQPPDPPGGGFITPPDDGGIAIECNVWDQDCPAGEKCMPWANDGGNAWNATRCSPIDVDPDQVGDECVVEGSGVSGVDSCDIAQMCWSVDTETNMGTCVAFCSGSPDLPTCEPPATACSISNEGVLILCLPVCNPLAPDDCGADEGCYPSGDVFHCAPDASGDMGAAGDPCEFLNVCDPGLMCGDQATVPDCAAAGCCTAFCEVGDDAPCLAGQTCVPFYEMGQAPDMCLEDVGVCTVQ